MGERPERIEQAIDQGIRYVTQGNGSGAAVHSSGFAAVYVAALILGNSELPHRTATRGFAEGVAWLAGYLVNRRGSVLVVAPPEGPCLGARVGAYTDFNTFTSHSSRTR